MTAQLLDGRATSTAVREEVRAGVQSLKDEHGVVPGLATVLVGEDPGSASYVSMKEKQAEQAGMRAFGRHLEEGISQEDLLAEIANLNGDPEVHGILVQLPLPNHLDEDETLAAIALEKDVDGFHPVNIARLTLQGHRRGIGGPTFAPAMPLGCLELLDRYGVDIMAKEAVVLGPSSIVGLPTAMLLLHRGAALCICHPHTADLAGISRRADILVAAIDEPGMVKGDWVKPGAAVIDVGWSRVKDASAKSGYRVVGNVDFDEVREIAGHITPVPGGTGPMTIAMLLKNTLLSAKRSVGEAG